MEVENPDFFALAPHSIFHLLHLGEMSGEQ